MPRVRRLLAAALVALGVAMCTPIAAQDTAPVQRLRLSGSNTVGERLAPALVQAWARQRGWSVLSSRSPALDELKLQLGDAAVRADVEILAHGTSTGHAALRDGGADLWMASRPVSAGEIEDAARIGRLDDPAQEHVLALDGLAVIVHPRNPIERLELAQVRAIFAGRVRDWSELGGAPGAIVLHARDDRSGTWDTFRTLVLREQPLAAGARRWESTEQLAGAVAAEPRAIGFVGVAGVGGAKALEIADTGTQPLRPTRFAVATEDYLLARRLFLYTARDAAPLVRDFVEFALGPDGQRVVEEIGFVAQHVAAFEPPPRAGLPAEYVELTEGARRLSVNFRFGTGVSFLDSKALRDLDRLVQWMRDPARRGSELLLVGFADGNESNPYMAISLSSDRADFVAQQLADRGVPARRVRGVGHAAPVAAEDTERGRTRNRRVEVWIREAAGAARAGSPAAGVAR